MIVNVLSNLKSLRGDITSGKHQLIKLGIPQFDEHLGLRPGCMTTIAAAPGIGKSVLCIELAKRYCMLNRPVLYFSYEMSSETIAARLLSNYSGQFSVADIFDNQVGSVTFDEFSQLEYLKWFNVCCVSDIKQTVQCIDEFMRLNPESCPLVVIDYLQYIAATGGSEYEQLNTKVSQLKDVMMKYNVPMLVISNLKQSDLKSGGTLDQSSFKGSSSIIYTTDNAWMLSKPKNSDVVTLSVVKSRTGSTQTELELVVNGKYNTVEWL